MFFKQLVYLGFISVYFVTTAQTYFFWDNVYRKFFVGHSFSQSDAFLSWAEKDVYSSVTVQSEPVCQNCSLGQGWKTRIYSLIIFY